MQLHTKTSRFHIDLKAGGQWLGLWFQAPSDQKEISVVSGYRPSDPFFASGSFLMFPWVNRLALSPYQFPPYFPSKHWLTDRNGISLHGLYHGLERTLLAEKQTADSHFIELGFSLPEDWKDSDLAQIDLKESYNLLGQSLKISYSITNNSEHEFSFALGIHPYFRMGEGSGVDDLKLFGSGFHEVQLDDNSLPKKVLEDSIVLKEEMSLEGKTLDTLYKNTRKFQEQPYIGFFSISRRERLRIQGDQNTDFFQVYTPSDRKSIAIEPMTGSGNFLHFEGSRPLKLAVGESINVHFFVILEEF